MDRLTQCASDVRPSLWASLDQPLPEWACVLGWCAATGVFVLIVLVLGGPSTVDSVESMYSTWAVAHGHLACAFPATTTYAYTAPGYPLVSGAIAALTRLGSSIPFPSTAALGPHCATALPAMSEWSSKTGALSATVDIGYISWLFLMAGAVAFLRAVGRGRCRWEPLTLIVLACLPPVWGAIETVFHPQDLMAMGLALGGLACVLRRRWAWAGVLLALAVLSQQFALLVAAPIFVLAPRHRRLRFSVAALGTAAVIALPLIGLGSGKVLRTLTYGSGDSSVTGGTLVTELRLHGWVLAGTSRVLPIVLSMVLAWWLVRRLGAATVRSPLPLASLVALSLSLRLVFEENLRDSYYFMALAVALVLLDVVCGRIRGPVVAWLALVTLAHDVWPLNMFGAVSWGFGATEHLPQVLIVLGIVIVLVDVARARVHWYRVAWLLVTVAAFATWPFTDEPFRTPLPKWFWQLVLVSIGMWLAAGPLVRFTREREAHLARDATPPHGVIGSVVVPHDGHVGAGVNAPMVVPVEPIGQPTASSADVALGHGHGHGSRTC